jgi:RimJ/RimL family protein N-acetyltransferase
MKSLESVAMHVHKSKGGDSLSIKLKNGQTAILRLARPDDAGRIQEMHGRLSLTSLYFRYLYAYKPELEDMQLVSQQDDCIGAAFVAVLQDGQDTIIGLSNYRRAPQQPDVAEPAVIVEDRFQRQGVGSALLQRLQAHAVSHGIRAFHAIILPSNNRMRRLVARSGSHYESKYNWEQGVLQVTQPLAANVDKESAAGPQAAPNPSQPYRPPCEVGSPLPPTSRNYLPAAA